MKAQVNLIFILFILTISFSHGNSFVYEEAAELYWPVMNIDEIEKIEEDSRRPSSENLEEEKSYKSIEELQNLVDVCWYRCSFSIDHN
ncbi:hypothetical protein [Halobacteriovorax sp. JY17]|uniref:hypothetical protein n=1 Tax=Halobacteriovorax sp. JY17 TaxID=2014617 RepID=UPI000C58041F|nr:hypothetical protein [Halobacteriovorax sp. JY17]PIK16376.1 MAG: hypothetical protein CES88_06435 [Halobacteriovorax sp. JY17]